MASTIEYVVNDSTAKISIKGRFDFTCHRDFRSVCDEVLAKPTVKQIDLNFQDVDYLDSSALGMLLVLRERTSEANVNVNLVNCHGMVKQVLEIANFSKLFNLV